MNEFKIETQPVGDKHPCYIIAEMSANHNGSFEKAIEIIHAAKSCGADAVKLQTYRADAITLNSTKEDFLLPADNPWESHNSLYALYEKAAMPWEWHRDLIEEGKNIGIHIFSSPFDHTAIDLLEDLDVPAYKIASPEITDIPLIKRAAQTGKPVILSTGLAELEDIDLAVETLNDAGCSDYAFLKCTTAYPAPAAEINLRTIPDLAQRYNCVAGISDHTLGVGVSIAAVALGARMIEKHFILSKEDESVDAFFSLDPKEFKELVDEVRTVEEAIGNIDYSLTPSARKNELARRSLYVAQEIKAGTPLTTHNIKSVRPSYGLHPKEFENVLGKIVNKDLEPGDRLTLDDIE